MNTIILAKSDEYRELVEEMREQSVIDITIQEDEDSYCLVLGDLSLREVKWFSYASPFYQDKETIRQIYQYVKDSSEDALKLSSLASHIAVSDNPEDIKLARQVFGKAIRFANTAFEIITIADRLSQNWGLAHKAWAANLYEVAKTMTEDRRIREIISDRIQGLVYESNPHNPYISKRVQIG